MTGTVICPETGGGTGLAFTFGGTTGTVGERSFNPLTGATVTGAGG
jgi:hypothetical protein